eukprot:scaffold133873_cov23-Tisochrysis_lutea.AAC.1
MPAHLAPVPRVGSITRAWGTCGQSARCHTACMPLHTASFLKKRRIPHSQHACVPLPTACKHACAKPRGHQCACFKQIQEALPRTFQGHAYKFLAAREIEQLEAEIAAGAPAPGTNPLATTPSDSGGYASARAFEGLPLSQAYALNGVRRALVLGAHAILILLFDCSLLLPPNKRKE